VSNVLPREKQLAVLAGLVEGNSERGVERYTERVGLSVTRKTIGRFALTLGTAAQHLHNSMAFNLRTEDIEQDEVWSYVKKKQARCTPAESAAGFLRWRAAGGEEVARHLLDLRVDSGIHGGLVGHRRRLCDPRLLRPAREHLGPPLHDVPGPGDKRRSLEDVGVVEVDLEEGQTPDPGFPRLAPDVAVEPALSAPQGQRHVLASPLPELERRRHRLALGPRLLRGAAARGDPRWDGAALRGEEEARGVGGGGGKDDAHLGIITTPGRRRNQVD
jgi:hypothetical protein